MRLVVPLVVVVGVLLTGCFVESRRDYEGFYESCASTADCIASADACFVVDWVDGRGRMCSAWCEVDADCPGWSACYELVGDPAASRICYGRCNSDRDCDLGFTCAEAVMDGEVVDTICLPL